MDIHLYTMVFTCTRMGGNVNIDKAIMPNVTSRVVNWRRYLSMSPTERSVHLIVSGSSASLTSRIVLPEIRVTQM